MTLAYTAWTNLKAQESDHCVVLYYHGVTKGQVPGFSRQMRWLKSQGSIIPLRSLVTGDWSGQKVCITFDDGLDNVRQYGLPILRELSIPVTIFAVSGNLGREPFWAMADCHPDRHEILSTADQLKEYPPDLIEIGSHTMTHPDLSSLTGDALAGELLGSRQALEKMLGREVFSLSIPFGSYNQESLSAAREAGYRLVVTCDPVVVRPGDSPLAVGRFKVTPDDWSIEFRLKAAGAHQWRRAWQKLASRVPGNNGFTIRNPASAAKGKPAK
jgi:peptidoglycan/xylan/chitin deacetylase (PgdA/CDA1 family)